MISVIIPVYKTEEYLDECIQSVVNQTYQELEIILVDDGSPDNCPKMCDEWAKKDSRIRVVHKENGGVSYARNAGIMESVGDYIAFVDSDDYVDENAYAIAIKAIEEYRLDLVNFGYKVMFDTDCYDVTYECSLNSVDDWKQHIGAYINTGGTGSVANKVYVSSIIKQHNIKFNELIKISEDSIFNCDYLMYANKIKSLPECMYFYRKHYSSLSLGRVDYIVFGMSYMQAIEKMANAKGVIKTARPIIKWYTDDVRESHLMFILLPNKSIANSQRRKALKELYMSVDNLPLQIRLKTRVGFKNKIYYWLYKLRCSNTLIFLVHCQSFISQKKVQNQKKMKARQN